MALLVEFPQFQVLRGATYISVLMHYVAGLAAYLRIAGSRFFWVNSRQEFRFGASAFGS